MVPWNLQHSDSGLEVLEAEQDSLHLCLLRLNFRLQDLEQGLGSWTLAHNRIVQLQVGSGRPGYGGVGRVLGMGVSFLEQKVGLLHILTSAQDMKDKITPGSGVGVWI